MSVEKASATNSSLPIHIALFGQPRVSTANGCREFPLPRKTLNVLAYLILNRHRPPMRETVAFALFPDDEEEAARGGLRRNLSYLLSALPALPNSQRFVLTEGKTLAWNAAAPATIDIDVFERAIAEGRDDDAVAAYAGELLPTLYDDWTTGERERLRSVFHEALVRIARKGRSLRRFEAASATVQRLLDDDPWREDIVRQLIAIRYEAGDRAGALAAFERFVVQLRAEMHTDPMPETIALHQAVLRGTHLATSERAAVDVVEGAPSWALPLVGRDELMETARGCWHSAADGRSGLLFVAGEAGIGKTRFTIELARTIEAEGGVVVRGETSAGGENMPYEAFVDALRNAGSANVGAVEPNDADRWRNVLEELLDEHAGATLVDDRSARVRLFNAVRNAIIDLARSRPLVLVLEDLHWAGSATIELLDFIAMRVSRVPVLIVVTLRTDELSGSNPLRVSLRGIATHESAAVIVLPRLRPAEARSALRATVPAETDDATIARAVDWADGVPFLLTEALRDIGAGREVTDGNINALVGQRFTKLSNAGETALVFGAILGARFELAALAAATGFPDDELIEALSESIELGLIRASVRVPGLAFAFTHHLVHEAATELISSPDRTRAHALVARVLCAQPRARSRAAEIARHFEFAGEKRHAAEQFAIAARHALAVFANVDASDAASAGFALTAETPEDRHLRYDLVDVRERARTRIGARRERRADSELLVSLADEGSMQMLTALERLFDAYVEDGTKRAATLNRLEALAQTSERAAGIYERALTQAAYVDGNFLLARDAALRAAVHFECLGDGGAAFDARCKHINALVRLAAYEEATAAIAVLRPIAEANDDPALQAEFYRVASSAETRDGAQALADGRRSLELAIRMGDRYAEARAHQNVGVSLGNFARDYAGALDQHEHSCKAYRDVGDAYGVFVSTLNIVTVRGFCGDRAGAIRLLDTLDFPVPQQPYLVMSAAANRGTFALLDGEFVAAERHLTLARSLALDIGSALYAARMQGVLGELYARCGRDNEAEVFLSGSIGSLEQLDQPRLSAKLHAVKARFHAGLGQASEAKRHLDIATDLSNRTSIQHFGEMAWNMAAAFALLGNSEAAERFAQGAARAFAEEAMSMDAALAEASSRLSWHVDAFAYLGGRTVSLPLNAFAQAIPHFPEWNGSGTPPTL